MARTSPEKQREYDRRYREKTGDRRHQLEMKRRRKNQPLYLFTSAKKRATKKNQLFTISVEDIVVPEVCPVLGITLAIATGHRKDNSPSVDRIDNSKGYIPGNVQVISNRANRIKSDAKIEELLMIAEYMKLRGCK